MSARFRREGARILVTLSADEADALATLAGQLAEMLAEPDPGDPAVARLFPTAYTDPTEERAEREWQALSGPDLLRQRLDALDELVRMRDRGRGMVALEPDAQQRWLTVLNDLRLVLGSRLGLRDDREPEEVARDSPAFALVPVYQWLTSLQGELIEVLLDDVPG